MFSQDCPNFGIQTGNYRGSSWIERVLQFSHISSCMNPQAYWHWRKQKFRRFWQLPRVLQILWALVVSEYDAHRILTNYGKQVKNLYFWLSNCILKEPPPKSVPERWQQWMTFAALSMSLPHIQQTVETFSISIRCCWDILKSLKACLSLQHNKTQLRNVSNNFAIVYYVKTPLSNSIGWNKNRKWTTRKCFLL